MVNVRKNEIGLNNKTHSHLRNVNAVSELTEKAKPSPLFLIVFGIYLSFHLNGFFGSIPGLRVEFNLLISALVVGLAVIGTPDFLNKLVIRNKGYLLFLSLLIICFVDLVLYRFGSALSMIFFPVFVMFSAFVYLQDKKQSPGLIAWIFLNFLYKIVLTLIYLTENELVVKQYDHIGYAAADGITRSIIGYGAVYLLAPMIILMIMYIGYCKSFNKVFVFITAFISIILVYMSQVSMMIFALTVMLFVYIICRRATARNKKLFVFIAVTSLCLIYIFRIPILEYMSGLDFLGDTVINRVTSLLNVMQNDLDYVYSEYGGSMVKGDSVVNRFYSYAESFKAFFYNFFLGDLTPNAYAGAGHSSLIDMVSRYGIFATLPWVVFVYNGYKVNRAQYPESSVPIGIVYIYILVISCVNTFSLSSVIVLTSIMIPQMCAGEPKIDCNPTKKHNQIKK